MVHGPLRCEGRVSRLRSVHSWDPHFQEEGAPPSLGTEREVFVRLSRGVRRLRPSIVSMSRLLSEVQWLGVGRAAPAGFKLTDVSVDLVAARPSTCDHLTFAGTGPNLPRYGSRTINETTDVEESLEGGDFARGETLGTGARYFGARKRQSHER
jgi:hypothetical protein